MDPGAEHNHVFPLHILGGGRRRDGQDVDVVTREGAAEQTLGTEARSLLVLGYLGKVLLEVAVEDKGQTVKIVSTKLQTKNLKKK